jgi:hypothetical protein
MSRVDSGTTAKTRGLTLALLISHRRKKILKAVEAELKKTNK